MRLSRYWFVTQTDNRITANEARWFYNRFGRIQDLQRYERHAADRLIGVSDFEMAHAVCKIGCSTGKVARRWYPIEDIPSKLILMRSKRRNDHRTIEFGPPEGAAFRHDKVRFIWFRVTPREPGEFSLVLFAFQPDDEPQDDEYPTPISEELILDAKVRVLQD